MHWLAFMIKKAKLSLKKRAYCLFPCFNLKIYVLPVTVQLVMGPSGRAAWQRGRAAACARAGTAETTVAWALRSAVGKYGVS